MPYADGDAAGQEGNHETRNEVVDVSLSDDQVLYGAYLATRADEVSHGAGGAEGEREGHEHVEDRVLPRGCRLVALTEDRKGLARGLAPGFKQVPGLGGQRRGASSPDAGELGAEQSGGRRERAGAQHHRAPLGGQPPPSRGPPAGLPNPRAQGTARVRPIVGRVRRAT